MDVADLGDDAGGEHRADAGQLLGDLVAAVTGQQVRDDVAEHSDLGGELTSQLPQRGDLPGIGLRQAELDPATPSPAFPTMSMQVTGTPSLASTAWTWSLQLVRRCASLCR